MSATRLTFHRPSSDQHCSPERTLFFKKWSGYMCVGAIGLLPKKSAAVSKFAQASESVQRTV